MCRFKKKKREGLRVHGLYIIYIRHLECMDYIYKAFRVYGLYIIYIRHLECMDYILYI